MIDIKHCHAIVTTEMKPPLYKQVRSSACFAVALFLRIFSPSYSSLKAQLLCMNETDTINWPLAGWQLSRRQCCWVPTVIATVDFLLMQLHCWRVFFEVRFQKTLDTSVAGNVYVVEATVNFSIKCEYLCQGPTYICQQTNE